MTINLDTLIKIAADDISKLRRPDVYRVLEQAMDLGVFGAMADYICRRRPELKSEVDSCEVDLKS